MTSRHSKIGSSVIMVAVAFVFLAGLALASTTWAAPGSFQTSIVTPPPCEVLQDPITCTNGGKSIEIPPGAVPSGTTLRIDPLDTQPPCPASPADQTWLDHCYKVTWTWPGGNQPATFAKPVTDCLTFNTGDVAQAGGDTANLRMGIIFDNPGNPWTIITPTVHASQMTVCTNPDRPFFFQSLFTPKPTLPKTGGSDLPFYWLVALFGVLAIGVGLRAARVIR